MELSEEISKEQKEQYARKTLAEYYKIMTGHTGKIPSETNDQLELFVNMLIERDISFIDHLDLELLFAESEKQELEIRL